MMKLIFPNRFPSRTRHVLLVHRVNSQMSSETEEELKREIEELRAKVAFLRICSPHGPHTHSRSASSFTGVVLVTSEDYCGTGAPSVQAHKVVLISKSPVLKPCWRMRWKKVEVEPLRSVMCPMIFSVPLYTTCIQQRYSLMNRWPMNSWFWAEKYQVKHLKAFCEKFITSKFNNDNAVMSFALAHRQCEEPS